MTATVFDNYQTAHVWAQQSQARGRSHNGNLWFEGRAIFSYGTHYCAGYALPDCTGGTVWLTNADSSSVTTNGKHKHAVYRAIPGRSYSVDYLTGLRATLDSYARPNDTKTARRARAFPGIKTALLRSWPGVEGAAAILAAMGGQNCADMARALEVKRNRTIAARQAREAKAESDRLARDAKELAASSPRDMQHAISNTLGQWSHMGTGIVELERMGRRANKAAKEAKARGWTRIAAACRAHYKAIRAAVKDGEKRASVAYRNRSRHVAIQRYRDAVSSFESDPVCTRPGDFEHHKARRASDIAQAAAALSRHIPLSESTLSRLASIQEAARLLSDDYDTKAAAIRAAAIWRKIAEWREGRDSISYFDSPYGGAAVRAVGVEYDDSGVIVGGTLETSHRANVPLVAALRVFKFLKHCRDTKTAWRANGKTLPVGSFRVDSVTAQGDFVAGCHRIKWNEVAALAARLGVESIAPADTTESRYANV